MPQPLAPRFVLTHLARPHALASCASAALLLVSAGWSLAVDGDLIVVGKATINPPNGTPVLDLAGPIAPDATGGVRGLTLTYFDGTTAIGEMRLWRRAGEWQWMVARENPAAGQPDLDRLQMKLGTDNSLTLFNSMNTGASDINNTLVLKPGPAGTAGITINGSPVLTQAMGNLAYLTPAQGNAAYLPLVPSKLTVGGATLRDPSGYTTYYNTTYYNGTEGVFAAGPNAQASGRNSIALGPGARATGEYALAFSGATSSGSYTIAGGSGASAANYNSIAFGFGARASGAYYYGAIALGPYATSIGDCSSALAGGTSSNYYTLAGGHSAAASGWGSLAFGDGANATGTDAVALGSGIATGTYATAIGYVTKAQGFAQTVVGQFNIPQGEPNRWVATDDLFIIGNGETDTARANAFTVKKNGDTRVAGTLTVTKTIRVPESGDLSMGDFRAGVAP